MSVRWRRLNNAIRPKDHIARLRPDLASKYAPLTPEGNGLQSVYLTQVSAALAAALFALIGKEASSVADVGQEISKIERACRIRKVERMEHLIASHVQPWRDSSNDQRLDGENGLLLTPTVDHLFDKGFISFEDSGQLIVSPVADPKSLKRMGIDPRGRVNVGAFSQGQRRYLQFHRENVLRMARGFAAR